MLGDKETGKTNILKYYTKKKFDETYKETIGIQLIKKRGADFFSKEINCGDYNLILNIWDVSGDELSMKILPTQIYKNVSGFFICCSYDNIASFSNLLLWLNHIQKYTSINNRNTTSNSSTINTSMPVINYIPIVVFFNKYDLKNKKISENEIYKLISPFLTYDNVIVIDKVSAKENANIDNLFEKMKNLLIGTNINTNTNIYDPTGNRQSTDIFNNKKLKKSFRLNGKDNESYMSKNKSSSCCQILIDCLFKQPHN